VRRCRKLLRKALLNRARRVSPDLSTRIATSKIGKIAADSVRLRDRSLPADATMNPDPHVENDVDRLAAAISGRGKVRAGTRASLASTRRDQRSRLFGMVIVHRARHVTVTTTEPDRLDRNPLDSNLRDRNAASSAGVTRARAVRRDDRSVDLVRVLVRRDLVPLGPTVREAVRRVRRNDHSESGLSRR
jgi:hypothetical protein